MKTLRLEVFAQTPTQYQLRFFAADNTLLKTRGILAQELTDFIQRCQQHYQAGLSLQLLGTELYNWLNGPESVLDGYSQIYIPITHKLGNLAWELLHDGSRYCCANPHPPFTPLRIVSENTHSAEPENRPLRLLFMACSPEDVQPVLNFEAEESRILDAIDPTNVDLVVEESGTLAGLKKWLVDTPDDNFFDVVHLTGHAGMNGDTPVFLMETDTGRHHEATAAEIADLFNEKGLFPRLVFLSGCETAHGNDSLPSLCEALVNAGLPAVLGWAKPVSDQLASETAKILYGLLAEGVDLARAVALTRQKLMAYEQQQPHKLKPEWHLLRLYSDHMPLTALVTALDTPQRKAITPPVIEDEFFKNEKVCPASRFVGRRRLLQQAIRCLRAAKQDKVHYAQGMLLHGMGGLGKSSLAARLCDRLKTHFPERLIIIGKLDETALKQAFGQSLCPQIADINALLQQDKLPLATRLGQVLQQFPQLNWLIVLDDFEQNMDTANHNRMDKDAYAALQALCTAINQSNSKSRVIITSRYSFVLEAPLRLLPMPLADLQHADLQKKRGHLIADNQLQDFADNNTELLQMADRLGAGNPRLLERLYQVLASGLPNPEELFAQLAQQEIQFREELVLKKLLDYQTPATRRLIAALALFEIFMPKAVLASLLEPQELTTSLQAAVAAGLVEVSEDRYFVSRLVVPLAVEELDAKQQTLIYGKAAECLAELWWGNDYKINLEEHSELSRLAKLGEQKVIYSNVTGQLANKLFGFGFYNECKRCNEELLLIQQELSDKKGEGATLNNIAQVFKIRGDGDKALQYLIQALQIAQEIPDRQGEGAVLDNISQIYDVRGEYDIALCYLTKALQIRQEVGDKQGESKTLYNISQIFRVKGDSDKALQYLTQALQIAQEIPDPQSEGEIITNISYIYAAKGDLDAALQYVTQSLQIHQFIGYRLGVSEALNSLAGISRAKGDNENTLWYLEQSLQIRQAIGDYEGVGKILNNISTIYFINEDFSNALIYSKKALKIRQDTGYKAGECTALFNIGYIHLRNDEGQQAFENWIKSYQIAKQIDLAEALQNLDQLAKNLGGDGLAFWEALSQAGAGEYWGFSQ